MKKTLIITGGTGFIGSHTCVELIKYYNLVVIDNLINSKKDIISKIENITKTNSMLFYEKDLCDKSELDKIFAKHEPYGVIHFAGLKSVNESIQKPCHYYKTNIISTLNLLEIMEKYNCFNLIFSSSATVYGSGPCPFSNKSKIGMGITNPYGQTKYMIECILKDVCVSNTKWNIVALRYFNPIGAHPSGLIGENPNDIPNNLMPYILKVAIHNNTSHKLGTQYQKLKIFGNTYNTDDGTCERDFIHVIDLAKGHLSAINKIHELSGYNYFNLGTGNPTSVLRLVKTFEEVNNVSIPYDIVEPREGDVEISYCDPNNSYEILNWKTELSIIDMCHDAWNFQLKSYKLDY